ncbi:MAG: ATP-binding protein [Deltaproteobacteria bacterium]|nr:ATP-binding protein [Deltaproteobacteria bacterium]
MLIPVPHPATPLVGRSEEVARVVGLVREGARLVSIIGIGGLGKTRVAIAASHRAAEEGLDVAYCDVVAVHSAAEVALAVANALDVELPDSLSRRDPVDLVAAAIARRDWGRGTLLVVDNFEHLARTRAGEALPRLVSGAPRIQLLVTSRVALERPEELRVPLAPLACAGDDSPAVELLLARTRHAALAEAWRADWGRSRASPRASMASRSRSSSRRRARTSSRRSACSRSSTSA